MGIYRIMMIGVTLFFLALFIYGVWSRLQLNKKNQNDTPPSEQPRQEDRSDNDDAQRPS